MNEIWPGLCALLSLVVLLVLIIRFQVHAFIVLLIVSLGLGLAAGLPPERVIDSMHKGIGDILRDVALLLALGAILGRMLEISGAAEVIARRLIGLFGERNTSLALLLAAFLVGIPILFNIGFLVLLPIVYRLQKETGKSLLHYLLPMTFGLSLTHSLVPPHPGIVGAVQNLVPVEPENAMVQTILFGTLLSLPLALIGWLGPGRWWAHRQMVTVPENLGSAPTSGEPKVARSLALALFIVMAPLVLAILGFGAKLLKELGQTPDFLSQPIFDPASLPAPLAILGHTPMAWLTFLGKPTVGLLIPTALACWAYGLREGWSQKKFAKLVGDALLDVGSMMFLFGAAGGFKEVIEATGVGRFLAQTMMQLPVSPILVAYLVSSLVRAALGSATAAILTSSAVLAGLVQATPELQIYIILAVACGTTFMTQPADSGFWMVKEYGNLSERDVILRFNACRVIMSVSGVLILLVVQWLLALRTST